MQWQCCLVPINAPPIQVSAEFGLPTSKNVGIRRRNPTMGKVGIPPPPHPLAMGHG